MRSGIADKWRLSLLAMTALLAGCEPDYNRANYEIVAVKSRPQEGYDTITNTYGCVATVIRNIPSTRYFKNGRQEEYVIMGAIGYKDICK